MEIQWTEEAVNQIQAKLGNEPDGYIRLKYDTVDTGCVMNGVTALWVSKELDSDDEKIETNAYPVYVEKSRQIFMDETMKIDFSPSANSFQLKSPNQMLNPRMRLFDFTKQK